MRTLWEKGLGGKDPRTGKFCLSFLRILIYATLIIAGESRVLIRV
jgi:hypothetical protein